MIVNSVEINIILLIGTILSFAGPLAYSIWKETRFVQNWAAAGYGVASLSFGILYFYDSVGSEAGMWALGVFVSVGILFIALATIFRNSEIWDDERSLPFSYKTIAGFQLGFLFLSFFPIIFTQLPQMTQIPFLNIVVWGGFLTLMLHSTIAPIRYIKN